MGTQLPVSNQSVPDSVIPPRSDTDTVINLGLLSPSEQYEENANFADDANLVITDELSPSPTIDSFNRDDEDGIETEESRNAVLQALAAGHFNESKGYTLKNNGCTCCPWMNILPILMGSGEFSMHAEGWKIEATSKAGCYCCFNLESQSWQKITLKQGGIEVMFFLYQPKVWCLGGKKERIAHIYVPQREKRIGWIKYGDTIADAAIVGDCISRSIFLVSKIDDHPSMGIYIRNHLGIPAAVAQATKGIRYRGLVTWQNFDLEFAPLSGVFALSSASKAMILAVYLMWALTYKERLFRIRLLLYFGLVVLGISIGLILSAIS